MYPTVLYAELTPNPNTMKFVSDRPIFHGSTPVEYASTAESKGSSSLAEALFGFPFVKGVFISNFYITVTKNQDISWDLITFELREFIREFLLQHETVVEKEPYHEINAEAGSVPKRQMPAEPSEYDDAIRHLLDEYVKPAVEADGGAIDFVSFKEGVVTVLLRGSCAGCPSSTITLKNGIENLLTTELPAVKEVVAESV